MGKLSTQNSVFSRDCSGPQKLFYVFVILSYLRSPYLTFSNPHAPILQCVSSWGCGRIHRTKVALTKGHP